MRELETLAPVELLDGADQPEVSLLDQIEKVDAGGIGIPAGVGDYQPEVGSQEGVLGLAALALLAAELQAPLSSPCIRRVAKRTPASSPVSIRWASSTSCSAVSRSYSPMAVRYWLNEVGGKPAAFVGQFALETLSPRLFKGSGRGSTRQSSLILNPPTGGGDRPLPWVDSL